MIDFRPILINIAQSFIDKKNKENPSAQCSLQISPRTEFCGVPCCTILFWHVNNKGYEDTFADLRVYGITFRHEGKVSFDIDLITYVPSFSSSFTMDAPVTEESFESYFSNLINNFSI